MAELVEDGLIGVFVRYEDLFSVGEGLRDAFELLGGHLSVSSSADEDLAQGDGSVEVQVGLDVLVHDLHDLGQCLDSVPPQGLATEGSDELPLALHTVDVGTGGASVSGVDQGFVAVEPLHVLAHTPLLGEQAVSYINPDPAHRVDDSLETLEIHDGVMVYGYVRVVLNRVDRLIDAVVVVGGVYLVLFSRLYLDEEIPGYREQLDVSCLRHHLHEHDGIRAAPHLLAVRPRVHAKHEHVERPFCNPGFPTDHPLDPVTRGSLDLARFGRRRAGESLDRGRACDELDAPDQGDQNDK